MTKFYAELGAVFLGGGLGATLRFLLSRWVVPIAIATGFPVGILLCNLLGSLTIGVLSGLIVNPHHLAGPIWRAALMLGLLGGFTTFSSFSLDTILLIRAGNTWLAAGNIIASVVGCVLLAALGFWLGRLLN